MKLKFIAILKELNCELIRFEHRRNGLNWHWYEIEYKNKDGYKRVEDVGVNVNDEKESSISNKNGVLKYFRECVMV